MCLNDPSLAPITFPVHKSRYNFLTFLFVKLCFPWVWILESCTGVGMESDNLDDEYWMVSTLEEFEIGIPLCVQGVVHVAVFTYQWRDCLVYIFLLMTSFKEFFLFGYRSAGMLIDCDDEGFEGICSAFLFWEYSTFLCWELSSKTLNLFSFWFNYFSVRVYFWLC